MSFKFLKLVIVSSPIGYVGSGKGGGVEITLVSLIRGLISLGHKVILIAPEGSFLPSDCSNVEIRYVSGIDQTSLQHQEYIGPVEIPYNGILPKLLEEAFIIGKNSDAILNLSYDWLPIWISKFIDIEVFHLISMGNVSKVMKDVIKDIHRTNSYKFAFHTYRQACDYQLEEKFYQSSQCKYTDAIVLDRKDEC